LKVVLFSAVLAVGLLSGCADLGEKTEMVGDDVRDSFPTQEFKNIEMLHTKEGELSFKMTSPFLDRYDKDDRAVVYGGVDIKFYKDGEVTSHLTADSGEVYKGGTELRAIGNVIVVSDTGTTILTPELYWNEKEGKIRSDTTVTIYTEMDTLYGTGLIATEDLKERKVLHPTGITFRSIQPEDTTLSDEKEYSEGLVIDSSDSGLESTTTIDSIFVDVETFESDLDSTDAALMKQKDSPVEKENEDE
jgi:LPS export ABC transporter protein LptC